jgi:hypothetical protein
MQRYVKNDNEQTKRQNKLQKGTQIALELSK